MKRVISVCLILLIVFIMSITAIFAVDSTLTVSAVIDNTTKAVTISGNISSGAGRQITIAINYPSGDLYVNQVTSGVNGSYSLSYILSDPVVGAAYKVRVSGEGIANPSYGEFTYTGPAPAVTPTPTPGPTSEPSPTPIVPQVDTDGNVMVTLTAKLGAGTGIASAEVDAGTLASAFDKATVNDNGIKSIKLEVPKIEGATAYELKLPASFFTADNANKAVEVKTDIAAVTLPGNMLTALNTDGASTVSLTIEAADKSKLGAGVQAQIGNRTVMELSLKIDGKAASWSNENVPVKVRIPYTPTEYELKNPENITIWYIDDSGKAVSIPSGRYDAATGTVEFKTTHFGKYAVAFVQKTFKDISKYGWAKKQIEVLASKGIINGTSETTFSPATNISRADFLVMLVNTLGLTAKVDDNFRDVKPENYYYEAVGIAKKLGISNGTGNNLFNPKSIITRQDMMVLAAKAMKAAGKYMAAAAESDLDKFSDKEKIAAYAVDMTADMVKEGIITGSGNKINPLSNATRAEAAVMLYRIYNK